MESLSEEAQFQNEFGWYALIYEAAGGDFLKIDEVVKKKAVSLLTFLNFHKRKTELDIKAIQKSRRKK